jgi:hypothetical protein
MSSRTPRQIAAGQRRSLQAIEKKIRAMSAEWMDEDAFNENQLGDLADKIKEVSRDLVAEEE